MEYQNYGETNCNRCSSYSLLKNGIRTGGLGNQRTIGEHPNDSIIEIGQNTEKSPGVLIRLVPQNQVKYHQFTLVRITLKE